MRPLLRARKRKETQVPGLYCMVNDGPSPMLNTEHVDLSRCGFIPVGLPTCRSSTIRKKIILRALVFNTTNTTQNHAKPHHAATSCRHSGWISARARSQRTDLSDGGRVEVDSCFPHHHLSSNLHHDALDIVRGCPPLQRNTTHRRTIERRSSP